MVAVTSDMIQLPTAAMFMFLRSLLHHDCELRDLGATAFATRT